MRRRQDGFTIIELMIATAVFTIILLITTTAIIGISNTYIKGQVQSQTQQTTRTVLSDISQDIQFSSTINLTGLSATNTDEYYFCIGSYVYVYLLDKDLSTTMTGSEYSSWDLVRYTATSCPSSVPASPASQPGAEELLAANQRLGWLEILQNNISGDTAPVYTIYLEIGYGSNDLLNDTSNPYQNGSPAPPSASNNSATPPTSYYPYTCQNTATVGHDLIPIPDSSFCAVSVLTTAIQPRITSN